MKFGLLIENVKFVNNGIRYDGKLYTSYYYLLTGHEAALNSVPEYSIMIRRKDLGKFPLTDSLKSEGNKNPKFSIRDNDFIIVVPGSAYYDEVSKILFQVDKEAQQRILKMKKPERVIVYRDEMVGEKVKSIDSIVKKLDDISKLIEFVGVEINSLNKFVDKSEIGEIIKLVGGVKDGMSHINKKILSLKSSTFK